MEESWWRKWKVVRKWNIIWKGILFLFSVFFSTMLTACVFVTRHTVRHPRCFVLGKFVCKPNCSWSEAFVNRGLTVYNMHKPHVDVEISSSWFSNTIMIVFLTDLPHLILETAATGQAFCLGHRTILDMPEEWRRHDEANASTTTGLDARI